MSTYQTQGFILSSRDFREADKIFSICTDTHGKIEALACGVRKIKSKLRAHLEPFSVLALMIAPGRRYDRLIGAITQKSYLKIKNNYQLLFITYQLLEITDQLTKPVHQSGSESGFHHPDPRIFDLLKEVFDYIESPSYSVQRMINAKCQIDKYFSAQFNFQSPIYSYFIIRLLSYLGYTPELKTCVRCKNPVSSPAYFSVRDGSVICEKCANADQPISQESLKIFQKYLTQNLQKCRDVGNGECYQLIQQFLNYHLDQPLKSQIINSSYP